MFYFKPPRGNIHLQQLQECVVARMIYFLRMDNRTYNKSAEQCSDFEHMFSGTPMDRTGHFVLRLLMSGAQQLTEFFIRSEAKLFIERINNLSTKDLLQFLKTSIRHVEELLKSTEHHTRWLNTAVEVLKYIYSSALKSHYTSFHHDESCSQHMLTVPFEYCLPLVKKREINLIRGNGKVPCGKWKKLVESLFYYHLDFSLKDIASQNDLLIEVNCDQRLLDLKKTLKQMYSCFIVYLNSVEVENNRMDESIIYATEVEELSSYFPPCMSVLYTNLKAKHRLGHQARFSFSLYLKDIGMPVKESIQFWKHEYLKPKNCSNSGCTHSWQRDSAKFEYNIRHMYGLEGSRNNYSAPSCLKIHCSVLGPASEGGCPFIHFDEKSLALFLNPKVTADEEVYNNIVQLKINRKPEDACFLYSKTLAQTKCPNAKWNYETLHKNPVQFYNRVKNSVSEYVQSNHRK